MISALKGDDLSASVLFGIGFMLSLFLFFFVILDDSPYPFYWLSWLQWMIALTYLIIGGDGALGLFVVQSGLVSCWTGGLLLDRSGDNRVLTVLGLILQWPVAILLVALVILLFEHWWLLIVLPLVVIIVLLLYIIKHMHDEKNPAPEAEQEVEPEPVVIDLSQLSESGIVNGHSFVDLGLPSGLKWASCNVGAEHPHENGGYFAWGEVSEKDKFSFDNYRFEKDGHYGKYINEYRRQETKHGFFFDTEIEKIYEGDGLDVLEAADDIVAVEWGGPWRMPTAEEQDELLSQCEWVWSALNGQTGYRVTGPNGNSIFLPATGRWFIDIFCGVGSDGCYWSSSLDTDRHRCAYCVCFSSSRVRRDYYNRDRGLSVRPVSE